MNMVCLWKDGDGLSTLLWLMFIGFIHGQSPSHQATKQTYESLFNSAVLAYNQERWFECSSSMQMALDDRKIYRNGVTECRNFCREVSGLHAIRLKNFDDVTQYLDVGSNHSECVKNCLHSKFEGRPEAVEDPEIEAAFDRLQTYDYLQMCAYKSDQFQLAMSAAHTFLVAHPNHDYMPSNIQYYRSLPQAKQSYFIDLESKQYQVLYERGKDDYGDENWAQAVHHIEGAAQQFYEEQERCLADCAAAFDPVPYAEFYRKIIGTVSLHDRRKLVSELWSEVLRCRVNCSSTLVHDSSLTAFDYLAEHYSYLQFSYFKLGELKMAAECTGTHLLLKPNDATMIHNRDYYERQFGINSEDFRPRQEASSFVASYETDKEMLITVEKNLASLKMDLSKEAMKSVFGPQDEAFIGELEVYLAQRNLQLVSEAGDLGGEHRVVVDSLLSNDQCEELVQLAMIGVQQSDSRLQVDSTVSDTNSEKFQGLTVNRAAELAREKAVSMDQVRVYLNASEKSRVFLEKYFNLQVPLLHQFTRLVCRDAEQDENQMGPMDLSHPVRADNCYLQDDGLCYKKPPTYIHRDIEGLLYLNDDFEGGSFIFASENQTVQNPVSPKCGRLVAVDSNDHHGMLPLKSGRRCALTFWFTFNQNFQELAYAEAETVLRSVANSQLKQIPNPAALQAVIDQNGYNIVHTESDLNGPERFVADNILTNDQCKVLIHLANAGGVPGEGYGSHSSPHTEHEHFLGLSVSLAMKAGGIAGDGYQTSNSSPHTDHEVFEGLEVLRAAELAAAHVVSAKSVRSYLNASEASRELVSLYFDKKIYFTYTHLVCRTAIDDSNIDRTDLSHPIHSDNCIIQPDNSCKRERPAYTERDYSALLYLNGDFQGGDFFFAHQNKSIQSSLRPKCGRLVGFNASNYHGVRAVISGQRCAVALWFTLDPRFDEEAHGNARRVLTELEGRAFGPHQHHRVEL